jgi:hypothetical protein
VAEGAGASRVAPRALARLVMDGRLVTMSTDESTDDWLAGLEDGSGDARDAVDLRAIGEALIAADEGRLPAAVAAARAAGRSWTEIAAVLGTSREAAQERFAGEFTRELAEQIREESERTKDDPYPPGTRWTRPNAG